MYIGVVPKKGLENECSLFYTVDSYHLGICWPKIHFRRKKILDGPSSFIRAREKERKNWVKNPIVAFLVRLILTRVKAR